MRNRAVVGLLVGLFLTGCGRGQPEVKNVVVENNAPSDADKILRDVAQSLHQATEPGHFRDGLASVNVWLSRRNTLPAWDKDERAFLEKKAHLSQEELEGLEAPSCPPSDAHYLAACYLFREVGAKLEVADAAPLDRAKAAFERVIRRVTLHEQGDADLPPALVLRRGFGNALDRALVFLELLRALELDAGLITPSTSADTPILVGVVVTTDKDKQLALFDPRLGIPVPGPKGKGVATLAQVQAAPELLALAGLQADATKLQVRAAPPLTVLAPRLRVLEKALAQQDRVRLGQNLPELCRSLAEAGRCDVTVWNSPALAKGLPPSSPLRRDRLFYPPKEGGLDTTGRWLEYRGAIVPWTGIHLKFNAMYLHQDLLPEPRENLIGLIGDLFNKFYVQPEDLFLRGQHEAVFDRLYRLRDEIETPVPFDDRAFAAQVAKWRETMNEAYARKRQGDPDADARLAKLWTEDQFILALGNLDVDLKPYRKQRKMLTHILFAACQDVLARHANTLLADCWHEKAALLQGVVDRHVAAGKNPQALRAEAVQNWDNTSAAWMKVLDRHPHGPVRWDVVQRAWQGGDMDSAIGVLEEHHRDLYASLRARFLLAYALGHHAKAEMRALGQTTLRELHEELTTLLGKGNIKKSLEAYRDQALRKNRARAARLDLLLRAWAPEGHLYWLQQTVKHRQAAG